MKVDIKRRFYALALASCVGCLSGVALTQETKPIIGALEEARTQLKKLEEAVDTLRQQLNTLSESQRLDKLLVNSLKDRIPKLDCQFVSAAGRTASCPAGFLATGCSAGQNKASHSIQGGRCVTDQDVDWTGAHCFRVV